MKEEIMNLAFKESLKSLKTRDIPVGAVIVRNNKIIAKAHNERVKKKNPLAHAEVNAIIKASKKIKNYNLNDCELYVTLKPCSMCYSIINNAKLKNVYYLLEKPSDKKEYMTNCINIQTNVCEEYKNILSKFFKVLRNK